MPNVVKKLSISSELAQKMVNAAVAKARNLGVAANVATLDDGANLKAFIRMKGAPIPTLEMAQSKAYTALFRRSTQDAFDLIQGEPSLLAGIPASSRIAAWGGGFPITVNGELVGTVGVSGAPTVQDDRLRVSSSGAPIRCGPGGLNGKPESVMRHNDNGQASITVQSTSGEMLAFHP